MMRVIIAALLIAIAGFGANAQPTFPRDTIYAKDFGVRCDGTGDDAAAIQAAINVLPAIGGTVQLPPGACPISTTINLLRTGSQFSVRFLGDAMYRTTLRWTGAADGTALLAQHLIGFEIANLSIENWLAAPGTTTGVHLTSEAIGSDCGPGLVQSVHVKGFREGWAVGDPDGHAASEINYVNFSAHNNSAYGIVLRGANSLNHQFRNLAITGNGVGLAAIDPDAVNVYGGSAAGNTVQDFAFLPSGQFGIFGFRSENAARFVTFGPDGGGGPASSTVATLQGIEINNTNAADGRAIRLNKMGHYTISGSLMRGHISLLSVGGMSSLNLIGNAIQATAPIEIPAGEYAWNVTMRGNTNSFAGTGTYWPDQHYFVLQNVGKITVECVNVNTGNSC